MDRELSRFAGAAGDYRAGPGSKTRRRLMAAGLVVTCLAVAVPASAGVTLKVAGSGVRNWSDEARVGTVGVRQAGGHVSLDVALPNGPVAVSPFLDIYHRLGSGDRPRNNMSTNMMAGVNVLAFTGSRRDRITMYVGAGGGVARAKVSALDVDPPDTKGYKTRPMADALMGVELRTAKRVSLFFEPHYAWAPNILNGVSAHAGLAFDLDRNMGALNVRPATPFPVSAAPAMESPAPVVMAQPVPVPVPVQAVAYDSLAGMRQMVFFAYDKSDIDENAATVLNDKVVLFKANPDIRIVIVGFASQPGTDAYNMALGLRRADAAKAYLASQGVDEKRIDVATHGENQLLVEGPGDAADAMNQRNQFRLLVADPPAAMK